WMPELPEVETLRRGLARALIGRRIVDAELLKPKILSGLRARSSRSRGSDGRGRPPTGEISHHRPVERLEPGGPSKSRRPDRLGKPLGRAIRRRASGSEVRGLVATQAD